MTRRFRCVWLLAALLIPAPVAAQTSLAHPVTPPAASPGFLTNYNFHLDAAMMSGNDPRFDWDANFGGDLDVVDYGFGRLNFLANYQVILGNQFRSFDPNQGNYTLEFSSSVRTHGVEIAGVFHHVSRHLSDRLKLFAIAWNEAGVRATHVLDRGRWQASIQGDAMRVIEKAYVDYTWQLEGDVNVRYDMNKYWALTGTGRLSTIGVDAAIAGRSRLTGGRAEAGVVLNGRRGAVELFVAYDRRIDADPIDRQTQTFELLGFKLLSH